MIEKIFNSSSVNLSYAEGSLSGPPLLLIHGLFSRWQSFYYLIPQFEDSWHLFALDLRGHGKSDRAISYTMQDYMQDIATFIKDNIKEPTIIFGHSLGGMLGIMVAANFPELVKGLILGDSIISTKSALEAAESHIEKTMWWRTLAKMESIDSIITELKNEMLPLPNQKDLVPAYKLLGDNNPYFQFTADCFNQADPEMFTANIDHINQVYAEYQTDKLLQKIQCPVLLLQGNSKLGALMRDEDVEKARKILPKTQHVKLNNAGHMVIVQDLENVIKATVSFMESLGR